MYPQRSRRVYSWLRQPTVAVAVLTAAGLVANATQQIFRTRTDYVTVDVVVTDDAGRPVTDLTKSDFEIKDQGRVQIISGFQAFTTHPVRLFAGGAASPATTDVASNEPPTASSRLFVIVVDELHILEANLVAVKRVLTEFVESLSAADEVAVVFVSRSDLGMNFTSDPRRIRGAIDAVRGAFGFSLDARGFLAGGPGPVLQYAQSAARTLKNVVDALAFAGHARRAIIFVSSGSPLDLGASVGSREHLDAQTLARDLRDVFGAARRANVPIYTVDPRGLTLPEDAVHGGIRALAIPETRADVIHRIRAQQNHLSELAVNSGGRAFVSQSDLGRAVAAIVAENDNFYLLGYHPDPPPREAGFHEVAVTVSRPGLRVRARSGYVAPGSGVDDGDATQALENAMAAGVNVSGLALRALALPVEHGSNGVTTLVAVQLSYPTPPGPSVQIEDVLHVGVLALDPDARVRASAERAFAFRGRPAGGEDVTLLANLVIDLPPQPLTLRVGVASRALGRAGTVQFEVAPPRNNARLEVGGVLLGFADRPREPALGTDLLGRLVPFQPTTMRTFRPADTLRVFAPVFWRSRESAVDITFGVRGEGRVRQTIAARSSTGDRHRAALDAELPLRDLPPGAHALVIEARLPDGTTARRELPFSIDLASR